MAKDIKVTKTFSIGKNEYKKSKTFTFSDELADKHSESLEIVAEPKKPKE